MSINRVSRKKNTKETVVLNDTLDQLNLIGIQRTYIP